MHTTITFILFQLILETAPVIVRGWEKGVGAVIFYFAKPRLLYN